MKYFLLILGVFIILPGQTFCSHNIISGEYYIDIDPGEGNATPIQIQKGLFFKDNFESDNNGVGELNYTSFENWDVIDGAVDLVGEGFIYDGVNFDFWPGNGQYIDLDGTTEKAGTFVSKTTFSLKPGNYVLEFSIAGSKRGDTNTVTVSLGNVYNESFTRESDEPFEKISRVISISESVNAKLTFSHSGGDQYGLLLDNVQLSTENEPIWSEFSTEISLTNNIKVGPHYLFVRMKNENNVWGFSRKHLFIVEGSKTIEQAEYFIDIDPGEGKGTPLMMENDSFHLSDIETSSLSEGLHNIYVRMKNSEGTWGPSKHYQFEVIPESFVKRAEFFLYSDTEPGNGTALLASDGTFDEPIEDLKGEIDTSAIFGNGKFNLFVRAMNSSSIWGEPLQIVFEAREHKNPSISGKVTFSIAGWDNLSVKNAEVSLKNTDYKSLTDNEGKFSFLDVPPGNYTLSIKSPDFDEYTEEFSWQGDQGFNLQLPSVLLRGCGLKGDVNNDNKIDLKEAIHALQISTQIQ